QPAAAIAASATARMTRRFIGLIFCNENVSLHYHFGPNSARERQPNADRAIRTWGLQARPRRPADPAGGRAAPPKPSCDRYPPVLGKRLGRRLGRRNFPAIRGREALHLCALSRQGGAFR